MTKTLLQLASIVSMVFAALASVRSASSADWLGVAIANVMALVAISCAVLALSTVPPKFR